MKISLEWLSDYIELKTDDIEYIKSKITESSAEVEGIIDIGENMDNIVIGKIQEITKHPDADKLKIVQTDIGTKVVQIVCGGSNLKEGMTVVVGLPGCKVKWHGEGDYIVLEKTHIRGIESEGMICASTEIGVGDLYPLKDENEILDLSHMGLKIGASISNALKLDDKVLDIDNHAITHRADLFSHIGFAKEFVACGLGKKKEIKDINLVLPDRDLPISIEFEDPEICARYSAITLENIEIKESPDYIKRRLRACGIRPINNIVDVTNYVMLEYGLPCHAFDLRLIAGNTVTHRLAKEGEYITTLDGVKRELPEDAIIIEDEEKIFDLAGIMGGENSEIKEETNKIWLHIGVYNKVLIRRTMVKMGHRTDAATIFEKGVSPYYVREAIMRGVSLIIKSCPNAKITSRLLDKKFYKDEVREIDLYKNSIERLSGMVFKNEQIINILEDLGFVIVSHDNSKFKIKVPGYRLGDIAREADLIEEIVRIHGFNQIKESMPRSPMKLGYVSDQVKTSRKIREIFIASGLSEVYTYSFLGKELLDKFGVDIDNTYIKIMNYITEDISIMRQSLLPRLLEITANNLRYQEKVKIFELSKVYYKKDDTVQEPRSVAGVICYDKADFYEAKGVISELFSKLCLNIEFQFIEEELLNYIHPGRNAAILNNNRYIGFISELHPIIKKNFDINKNIVVFEIDFDSISEPQIPVYKSLLKFPTIVLDLNIVIPKYDLAKKYKKIIEDYDPELINKVIIKDEYIGDKIPADKRSITFSIEYADKNKTLKDKEVNKIHMDMIKQLELLGAELRK